MSNDAIVVLVVLGAILVTLATDRVPTTVAMGGGLFVLLVTGSIDDDVALSGLSSPATATIAALYVAAAAVSATGAMSWVLDRMLFGRGIGRMATAVASMSTLVPNTPLVALAAPRVVRWSRRSGRSASKLLMPLSFASILGGVVTVLGTSTNLVVSDALQAAGEEPLGVFEITPIGLPVAVVGIMVLVIVAPLLLKDRTAAGDSMRESARRFQIQMVIAPGGPLARVSIEAAGLRDLDGVYLAAVERGEQMVTARPDTRLLGGDRLYFVGDVGRVVDLQEIAGLVSAEESHLVDAEGPGVRLFEAVVAGRSDLSGRTLKDAGFRARYGAAVLAVHRADGELRGKLGAIPLHVGDVLLVLGGAEFSERWREHGDFSLVASLGDPPPPRRNRALLAAGSFAALVVLAATGLTSLLLASLIGAGVVVAGGALSVTEARRAIDLNVVLTIAASISLGNAVVASGLSVELAEQLARLGDPLGATGLLFAAIIVTQILTEMLSNSGAAAIMVPVAMGAAAGIGADPRVFAVGVLVGASCSFLTPVGYQTNLMVYGLGGYQFRDFTRVGLPLTISSAVVATVALQLFW